MEPVDEPEEHEDHEDHDETELMRVWLDDQEMRVDLYPGVFEDPTMWGVVLANLAQYIASGLQETDNLDPAETLKQIVQAFHDELANPSSDPE
jgi:hypothetical protein